MADVTVIESSVNQDLKSCLSKHKKEGNDLYEHVSQVMSHIVQHCPRDSLNKFEEVSYLIKKQNSINIDDFLKTRVAKDYAQPADESTKASTSQSISEAKKFFTVRYHFIFIYSFTQLCYS